MSGHFTEHSEPPTPSLHEAIFTILFLPFLLVLSIIGAVLGGPPPEEPVQSYYESPYQQLQYQSSYEDMSSQLVPVGRNSQHHYHPSRDSRLSQLVPPHHNLKHNVDFDSNAEYKPSLARRASFYCKNAYQKRMRRHYEKKEHKVRRQAAELERRGYEIEQQIMEMRRQCMWHEQEIGAFWRDNERIGQQMDYSYENGY